MKWSTEYFCVFQVSITLLRNYIKNEKRSYHLFPQRKLILHEGKKNQINLKGKKSITLTDYERHAIFITIVEEHVIPDKYFFILRNLNELSCRYSKWKSVPR